MTTSAALIAEPTSPTTLPKNSLSFASFTSLAMGILLSAIALALAVLMHSGRAALDPPLASAWEFAKVPFDATRSSPRPLAGDQASRPPRGPSKGRAPADAGLQEIARAARLPRGDRAIAPARTAVR